MTDGHAVTDAAGYAGVALIAYDSFGALGAGVALSLFSFSVAVILGVFDPDD